ncbi:hypothetical protein OPQ81_010866 [Rhizoctonia solani]|nr:hypothetical protein OPQ81_010866 [Rhizoctonia solani]
MRLKSVGLWLFGSGVLRAAAFSSEDCFGGPINNRTVYLACAKQHGLCRKKDTLSIFGDSQNRKLVRPGKDVLAKFDICVAKNEFGEKLQDTSGDVFCQGEAIHLMADASYDPYSKDHVDSKTFVDQSRVTSGTNFNNKLSDLIDERDNFTVKTFLEEWNKSYVSDVEELKLYNNLRFPHTPDFIFRIRSRARILRAWSKIVHHKWNNLNRLMEAKPHDYLIPGPGSHNLQGDRKSPPEKYITSAIRMEHPFVIAGGRFREQYYWDSFFVMEGLLAANMSYLARTTLLNFMDQIKAYGFIPNGARKYYLNRSQPPLFIHMLYAYVQNTGDHQILHEALPLAERELRWWHKNRSVDVRLGDSNKLHTVYQYRVKATGPRPESYAEDWRSAWCFDENGRPPNKRGEISMYSEFASGAESGWDYTARWMNDPFDLPQDEDKNLKNLKQMKRLEIRRIIPVDLNSIIYRCHVIMAELYKLAEDNESPFAHLRATSHIEKAGNLSEAIIALHWDPNRAAFYDFLLDRDYKDGQAVYQGEPKYFWSMASLAPYWSGIWPGEFHCNDSESKDKVMKAFSGVRKLLDIYRGPLPATLVESGQQWDFPNAWPPLQYIAIKALESIPQKCIENTKVDKFVKTIVPKGQLALEEEKLPKQPGKKPDVSYYVSHSWRDSMVKVIAMRYMTSTFCTWNVTGDFPEDRAEMIERHNPERDAALKDHPGLMYEKLNAISRTKPGGGGEYEVQTGFGWTNGIAMWIAHQYGGILDDPKCLAEEHKTTDRSGDDILFQG